MINLSSLNVTHNELRNASALEEMVKYVKNGGLWDKAALSAHNPARPSPLIQITQFEDGQLFIHDGHHRSASIYLAGRTFLHDTEYEISKWTYHDYAVISHANGWYTPFDPRHFCRTPDFAKFKHQARQKFIDGNETEAIQWIEDNPQIYCEPRTIHSVLDLVTWMICKS
jgi:hypothetical protein